MEKKFNKYIINTNKKFGYNIQNPKDYLRIRETIKWMKSKDQLN